MCTLLPLGNERDHTAPPRHIVVTIPQAHIKKRPGGYRDLVMSWKAANVDSPLLFEVQSVPRDINSVVFVYIVVRGRIRWKSTLIGITTKPSEEYELVVGMDRTYLLLCNFKPIPRNQQVLMNGFGGYRSIHQDNELWQKLML